MVVLLLLAGAAVLLGAVAVASGSRRRPDDVERFHRARGITSGWARDGLTRPVVAEQERASTDV